MEIIGDFIKKIKFIVDDKIKIFFINTNHHQSKKNIIYCQKIYNLKNQ